MLLTSVFNYVIILEMIAYSFTNTYISGVHVGIQSAHAIVEIIRKHPNGPGVRSWISRYKTLIVKNGGDSSGLQEIVDLFKRRDNKFAWAEFREPDMENVRTSVAIIVPERIGRGEVKTPFEEELKALLKRTKLAV
jgi:hypothetical protein